MRNTLSNKKAVVFLVLYFGIYLLAFQDFLSTLIAKKFGMEMYFISNIAVDLCMLFAFVLAGLKYYTQSFNVFVSSLNENIKHILTTVGCLFLTNILLAQLIYFILPTVQADNQINNDLVFNAAPVFYILTAVVFAPFLEETIFRGCIFAKIREKHGFLLSACISGGVFGFLHVVASLLTQNYSNCIFFVIYALCGFVLCIPYEDTDTITTSIFSHMLYNFMTILITLWMS